MKLWIMGGIESIRFFTDDKSKGSIIRQAFVEFDSDEYHKLIEQYQGVGCGAFFTVNRTNGRGATVSDIMQVRSYYIDLDGVPDKDDALLALLGAKLQPSAIIETKRGFHAYWYASEPLPVNKDSYNEIQMGLLKAFKDHGADGSAKDLARILRIPGTCHLKEPKNPFLISVVHQRAARLVPYYSRKQMLTAFPPPQTYVPNEVTVVDSPKSWLLYLSDLSNWESKPGDRNMVMLLSAGVAIRFKVGLHKFVSDMLPIVRSWGIGRDELQELSRVAKWAYAQGKAIPPSVVARRGVPIRKGL